MWHAWDNSPSGICPLLFNHRANWVFRQFSDKSRSQIAILCILRRKMLQFAKAVLHFATV
ncbi:hypothetical protein AAV99_01680 [Aurantiacibacter marinus]|uniref:Uncharacterized protein n=1 Tax=Aurantiacibacter marinus TaxID=874156 RepID=A0A0H0XVR2_9SPHN|nr:hypothetical protein AAV99_01680 [Aurantiacibacter marinus]